MTYRWPMACAALSLAASAQALETDLKLRGVAAGSFAHYSADATGDEDEADNNASFIGLSGSVAEGDFKAFAVFEYGAERFNDVDTNTGSEKQIREFFGGVAGPFGTLSYGRQSTYYKQAGRQLDPFYDTSVAGFNGQYAIEGAGYGLSNLTNEFADDTVAYQSPSLMGFTLRGSVYLSEGSNVPGADDDYGAGLLYENTDMGFAAGVEYLEGKGGDVVFGVGKQVPYEAFRVYGGYKWNALSLGASLEHVDVDNEADPRKYGLLSASYQLMPALSLAATYGKLEDVVPNAAVSPDGINGDGLTLGAFYEVMPRLTTYVAARAVALDSGNDIETYALGASYEFEFELY